MLIMLPIARHKAMRSTIRFSKLKVFSVWRFTLNCRSSCLRREIFDPTDAAHISCDAAIPIKTKCLESLLFLRLSLEHLYQLLIVIIQIGLQTLPVNQSTPAVMASSLADLV